jgi:hypothetical protein
MTNLVTAEREALALLLRSKTALGRLVDSEVHSVLDFLESIGFVHQATPQPEPAPIALIVPEPDPAAVVIPAPPVIVAPIAPPPQ